MRAVTPLPTTCIHYFSDLVLILSSLLRQGEFREPETGLTECSETGRGNQKSKKLKRLVNWYPREKEQKRHWRKKDATCTCWEAISLSHFLLNNMTALSFPLCSCPTHFRPASFLESIVYLNFPYAPRRRRVKHLKEYSLPVTSQQNLFVGLNL